MNKMTAAATLATLMVLTGCSALAGDWPDRTNKSPGQMLADVIRRQQRVEVRESTGKWAGECFTENDYEGFVRRKRPEVVAEHLKKAADFGEIATALRALPPAERATIFKEARSIAHPTWAMMGRIDPSGQGQTEAGRQAELMIATAIVDAFTATVGAK